MDSLMQSMYEFLVELDKLKRVNRRAYLTDGSRHENSAEHSWHLTIAMVAFQKELDLQLDLERVLKMALVHDLGEIDAGDVSVFSSKRATITEDEQACIERLADYNTAFAKETRELWLEFEEQKTEESRWLKVFDRLLPFFLNMATEGRAWKDQNVSRSDLLRILEPVAQTSADMYAWMQGKIEKAVSAGWVRDS